MTGGLNDPLQFEVLAATLRLGRDTSGYLGALGDKLGRAVPDRVDITRKGLVGRKVTAVAVTFDDRKYVVRTAGSTLRCTIASIVRGVVLRTDDVDLDTWIQGLSRQLVALADESLLTRTALGEITGF